MVVSNRLLIIHQNFELLHFAIFLIFNIFAS